MSSTRWHLHRNKVLCFDSPTQYLLIFDNIFTDFGIPIKLVRLIKMCMNETYTRVQVVKNWSDMFTIMNDLKKGDVLSSLLLNSALDQAIRTVQVNQDSLKLNGTK